MADTQQIVDELRRMADAQEKTAKAMIELAKLIRAGYASS